LANRSQLGLSMSEQRADFEHVMAQSGELARYQVRGGERVLIAFGRIGRVNFFDVPADGRGSCFWVSHGIYSAEWLHGFVSEYVRHARELGCSPMSSEAIGISLDLAESCVVNAFVAMVWGEWK
jgi:hypothetical protein